MIEQKSQRKGRDFLIGGFIGLLLLIAIEMFLIPFGLNQSWSPILLITSIGALVVAPIVAFIHHRKFIGIGILTALVAVPLLMLGFGTFK